MGRFRNALARAELSCSFLIFVVRANGETGGGRPLLPTTLARESKLSGRAAGWVNMILPRARFLTFEEANA